MTDLDDFLPEEHLGRDLHVAYRIPAEGHIRLTIPVVEHLLRPDGTVRSEVLTTILDETTGFVAVFASMPDWGSTASLVMGFTGAPVEPTGELVVDGHAVKVGRRLVFVEADVRWGDVLVATTAGEFAKVGRAERNVGMEMPAPDPTAVFAMGQPHTGLDRSYPERLGIEVVDAAAGVVVMPFESYTRNSSGILHGGVVAALAVAAAEAAAGAPAIEAHVQYLSPGRVGPFRTCAERRYEQASGATVWRTETLDLGGEGPQRMTRATVTTRGAA
jgi:acyl-coenzyme A thioesterase PaaI-like protein